MAWIRPGWIHVFIERRNSNRERRAPRVNTLKTRFSTTSQYSNVCLANDSRPDGQEAPLSPFNCAAGQNSFGS
jgi:hypothetical protein